MQKWSSLLCKVSISKDIVEEVERECKESSSSLIESISKDVKDKGEWKQLAQAIKQLETIAPTELFNMILQELEEIKEDLSWIGTKKGKYIAAINDWQQNFYSEFRSKKEFENIFIGGHSQRMVVFLTGILNTTKEYERLLDYVKSKNPPFKLLSQVQIANNKK